MPPVIGELDVSVIAAEVGDAMSARRGGSAPLSTNPPRSRSGNARSCMRIASYAVDLHERLIQMPPPLRIAAHLCDPPPDRLMADVDHALG